MINTSLLKNINTNDEGYTLPYAITPILEFLTPNSTILCPFDDKDSNYISVLTNAGHTVCYQHINDGFDFFDLTASDVIGFDYIISNPPFSKRKQVIEKLFILGKPFAMLMPLVSIALKPIRDHIAECELLIFDKRIKFVANTGIICKNPQAKQLIFVTTSYPNKLFIEN